MNKKDILQKIVYEGNCNWSNSDTCLSCPMSKLKKRSDGTYLSCYDALGGDKLLPDQLDAEYVDKASKLLADLLVEEILEE